MGYESKLIVVKKYVGSTDIFGEVIAEINLSGMSNAFFEDSVFVNEIGKQCLVIRGEEVTTDCYGKKLTYASADDVLKVLYKCESVEHYRRTKLAINVIECFCKSTDWDSDNICIFHYGY